MANHVTIKNFIRKSFNHKIKLVASFALNVIHVLGAVNEQNRVGIFAQNHIVKHLSIGDNGLFQKVLLNSRVSLPFGKISWTQLSLSRLFQLNLLDPSEQVFFLKWLVSGECINYVLHRVKSNCWQFIPSNSQDSSLVMLSRIIGPQEHKSLLVLDCKWLHKFD